MTNRVVITGLGVIAPNGCGLAAFREAIQKGQSGLKFIPEMRDLNLGCHVAGIPSLDFSVLNELFSEPVLKGLKSLPVIYGCITAAEAWKDAGLDFNNNKIHLDTGCVFGNSFSDAMMLHDGFALIEHLESKKVGSRFVEQIMCSGVSAYISGMLGLGNRILTNSLACATGTQAVLLGYESIKQGYVKRMVAGSSESADKYVCACFDAMRVLCRKYNDLPAAASRPMSQSAAGFIAGSGAGVLILENLETALERNATIYAEILGGASNSGGQRNGGSMTAPSSEGVLRCIGEALENSETDPQSVDLISGHLTATMADKIEINNWATALNRREEDFPFINSLKSMTGHCLSAAGSIETVATTLQISGGFIHPNINCDDLHPEIACMISPDRIPLQKIDHEINIALKANFGFGDVNSCIVLSGYKN